jgi:hypothetical protein
MLITCTNCRTKMRAPDDAVGKEVQCPKCAAVMRVPAPDPPAPEAFSTTPTSAPPGADPDDAPRRRRYDDDEDDYDDLNVRLPHGRRPKAVNSLALASMIVGIVSCASVFGACFCGPAGFVAIGGSITAIILGFMGKTPGSESQAWTGIICGFVALGLALLGVAAFIAFFGMGFMG